MGAKGCDVTPLGIRPMCSPLSSTTSGTWHALPKDGGMHEMSKLT